MQYAVQFYFKENVVVNFDLTDTDENSAKKSADKMVIDLDKSLKSGKLYKIAEGNWVNPANIMALRVVIKEEPKVSEPTEAQLENV